MNPFRERDLILTRRQLFGRAVSGIGTTALASLCAPAAFAAKGLPGFPNFKPTAKRVIYLHQSGAPSQMDLFDPKPKLAERFAEELPDSIRQGQRLTGMTSGQKKFPVAPSKYKFARYGPGGTWMCELLPHTAKVAGDICVIKSLFTEAINHDPAITFIQTGSQVAGRPCFGSWISYGLGSESQDLPAFVVMISRGTGRRVDQPLYDRLWGSGFLPTEYQGVKFRSGGDPVLYLSNPPGIAPAVRRSMLDDIGGLNRANLAEFGDPEIAGRIQQYEMAYRMQTSVPELTDLSREPDSTFELYGPDARTPGTYAANCILARRLAERGVRFIQIYHMGWDHHEGVPRQLPPQCLDTDQPSAALIQDLKLRGMLDDTLVIWGGEFGRTVYCQGNLSPENYGRDHHPRCFSVWLAGGGIKPGLSYGETDDYSYNIVENPVHVHDLNATMMHCLGIDHTKLTYRYQGRDFRLTDVHGTVVKDLLA
uniref:Sulfatase n=1 Tax=Solibacter usitatus (strain Ellin6076) TaxID=234267 RepID=Q02AE9_SOLUE